MYISGGAACILSCVVCSIISFLLMLTDKELKDENQTQKNFKAAANITAVILYLCVFGTCMYFMFRSPELKTIFIGPNGPVPIAA